MTTIDPVPTTPPSDAVTSTAKRRPTLTRRLVAGLSAGALVVGLLVGGGAGYVIGNASAAGAATSGTTGFGTPPQMGGERPDFGNGTPPQMGEGGPGGPGTDGGTGDGTGTDGGTGTDDSTGDSGTAS